MSKNSKEIVVLDSDDDSSSDVEVVPHSDLAAASSDGDDSVVDLTTRSSSRVSSSSLSPNHPNNNSKRRRKKTDGEVEFIGSTSARQPSATAAASGRSAEIQFIGTKRSRPTTIPNQMINNNFNNNGHSMNNFNNNGGGFMDRLSSILGFGRGAAGGMNVNNNPLYNFGMGIEGMGRYGPIPGVNDRPSPRNNNVSRKRKRHLSSGKYSKSAMSSPKEAKPTAMEKGKAMQRPQGFDAIDMYYPRLKANDRTSILYNLVSNCTNSGKTKKFVHDFRVKFEKSNPKSTLWNMVKQLSEEITRLEGECKMPSSDKKKLKKSEDDNNGNQHKENKPVTRNIDDSNLDKKPTAAIGSLSGEVLDTLEKYFAAFHAQKEHKQMLEAIEPKTSPGSLTCCICSDDFDAGDTVACGGDDIHFFCKSCLSSYCTLTLESGPIQSIKCAMPDCKALFATHDIKSILSEYDILKIEHREESRDRRVAMAAKAMLHCECGVVAIVTEEDMGDGRIACPGSGCGRRFCAKCGNEDHGKESCPPPAETVQWLDKHSKQCPNCSNRIEKNGGCDHMKCQPPGGCGYDFWWTCGCPYPGPHKCR
jgi:hypothetical protein